MTMADIIKMLINAESYAKVRHIVPDDLIKFIREMLPGDYDLIAEKEKAYQDSINVK